MSSFNQEDFHDYEEVGSGGEGAVFRAKTKIFGNVAVKVFTGKVNSREIENMQKFSHHPNIIQYFGTVKVGHSFPPRHGFVMKYMSEGSVYDAIHTRKAARGIAYLHHNNVIHRDIKPSNMLFSDSLKTVLISDFGLAKVNERNNSTSFQGSTYRYMAPEIFQNLTDYSKSSDVFSFAISMWEIFTKRIPYAEYPGITDDLVLRTEVVKGTRPSLNESMSSALSGLLKSAWNSEAKSRPNMEDVLMFFEERKSNENAPDFDHLCEELDYETEPNTLSESQTVEKMLTESSKTLIGCIGDLTAFYDKIPEETTILILGELGVGSATFCNGLFNLLKYGTLEDATSNEMDIIIHESFFLEDEDGNKREVFCEPTLNGHSLAASSEQRTKSYKFSWGPRNNQKIARIVYIPEMGASGSQEHLVTVQTIEKVILELREVHAICIFLNPTETGQTAMFYELLQRILCSLSISVRNNVFFCFNTANESDCDVQGLKEFLVTMEKMKKIKIPLNEQTMFFFDNEAYRFLCALRQGFKIPSHKLAVFKEKWKKTSDSIFKFLKRMSDLPPYTIRNVFTYKNCRGLLCNFTRALLVLARIKMRNIHAINDKIIEIEDYGMYGEREEPLLMVEKIVLVVEEAPAPKSFCPSIKIGEQTTYEMETEYPIIRKNRAGVRIYMCANCNRSCQCHFSIEYELKEVKTMNTHREVDNKNKTKRKQYENCLPFMTEMEIEKRKIEIDVEKIVDAIRAFSIFLKEKTMLYEEDPYIECVEKLISDAKDDHILKEMFDLQEMLEHFSEVGKGESKKSPSREITEIYELLENLKKIDNGNILNKIQDSVTIAHPSGPETAKIEDHASNLEEIIVDL